MKINIQKGKRLCLSFLCFLSCACLLMAAVPAAGAVSVPRRFYTFDDRVRIPTSVALSELTAGVPITAVTYEDRTVVSELKIFVHANNDQNKVWDLYFGSTLVAQFELTAFRDVYYWTSAVYKTLEFDGTTDISQPVLDWLEDNGTFTGEAPLIRIPDFDLEEIFPEDIILGEYSNFADIVGIFIRNTVTAPFVLTLFGLVLVSFILFGKK